MASEIKGMIFDFIRGAHAVCNLSLCGIFLMILGFIRGVYAVYFRWHGKIISKIQLVENKEVTLLVELNW